MKIASEIAATLCENGIHRGALMDEEVSCIIASKLAPIRDALKQIANYGHSDKCDGWYDDKLGRIDPNTGLVYRFNSCPIYECDCGGNANGGQQWGLAKQALALFEDEDGASNSATRVLEVVTE